MDDECLTIPQALGFVRVRYKNVHAGNEAGCLLLIVTWRGGGTGTGSAKEEIEDISGDAMRDDYELDDEVFELHTQFLMTEARRLMIETPERKNEEMWTHAIVSGRPHLTKKGIFELRAAIRSEKRAVRKYFLLWVPGITGILGLIVALAAILGGKR